MDRSNEMRDIARIVRRQWLVVVAAVLAAMLVAGAYVARSAPEPSFTGTVSVTLINGASEVVGLPTVDGLIASVGSTQVRASVAESLGVETGKVPSASASVNGKNTRVIDIAVRAADQETAQRAAAAYAEAVRARALEEMSALIGYTAEKVENLETRIAALDKRLELVNRRLEGGGLTPDQRATYESLALNIETAKFTPADELASARLALAQYERYVYVNGEPRVKRSGRTGALASTLVRAALVGLVAGLGVAWIRERRAA